MFVYIADLFLAFLFYGFIGWIYESLIWAICEEGRFTNRGFMIGPVCPIYGVVSLMDWYLLHEIQSPFKVFLVAFLVCSALEFITSWVLEKLFKARWWDYSNYPFNLNGRISLYSSTLFGLAGLLLVTIVHPAVMNSLDFLFPNARCIIACVLFCLFTADLAITITSVNLLNKKVKQMYDAVIDKWNTPFDYLNEHKHVLADKVIIKKSRGILMTMDNFNVKLKHMELRIIKAFPNFKSIKYDVLFKQIRDKMESKNKD